MAKKPVDTILLEDLLNCWHDEHYPEQDIYYIFAPFLPIGAKEMIEAIGYEFPYDAPFYYVIPEGEKEKELIKRLKKRFGIKVAITTSSEMRKDKD